MSEALKIEVSSNAQEILGALQRFTPAMQQAIAQALDLQNELTIAQAQSKHLSGPRPSVLGVRSNRLRSSLRKSNATVSESTVESSIGTNVKYAGVHEFGFDGTVQVKPFTRKNPRGNRSDIQVSEVSLGTGRIRRRRSVVKTASGVSFVKAHSRRMKMPERSFIRSSVSERAPEYSKAISAAIVTAWNGGAS